MSSVSKQLILKCRLSPGDIVTLTAAVRDLHKCNPNQFITDVHTTTSQLWENNPNITLLSEVDPSVQCIDCHYPLIHRSNDAPYHFIHGFIQHLSDVLQVEITASEFKGDIYLSNVERTDKSQIELLTGSNLPFWLMVSGGKNDFTIKWWSAKRYQEVVDHFEGKIQFVLVGESGHHHPDLEGVIDLRGKTNIRELIKLVYHSQGILCGVTLLMHLAAAVEIQDKRIKSRPCVVIGGGREPVHWEAYPHHQFIHTIGALSCCSHGGCWKSRTKPIGDGDEKDRKEHLCSDVVGELPHCMDLITSDEVIRRINLYFEGRLIRYLTPQQAEAGARFSTHRLGDSLRGNTKSKTSVREKPGKSKLQVMHLLPYGNLWGTERAVINLCRAMSANTVGVVLLNKGIVAHELTDWGIDWFDLTVCENAVREGERLQRALKQCDVIHIHCCEYIHRLFKFAEQTKLPMVVTLHWPSRLPILDATILCPSKELEEMQDERNRTEIVPNGIDLELFSYSPKSETSKIILIRVGRPEKCGSNFLPVMKQVLAKNGHAELWIVGEEGDSTTQIKYLGIRSDVPALLSQADLFVNMPKPNEGAHDLAVIEAMAMGVPAVVTDVPCVSASITNRHDGILIPCGDEEMFVSAVNRLINDNDLRRAMASNALETAESRFDIRKVAKDYLRVYEKEIRGESRARAESIQCQAAEGAVRTERMAKKHVVLVGNGPSALRSKLGAMIESFPVICRFNNFQTKGYEDYIGSRTDSWAICAGNIEKREATVFKEVLFCLPLVHYDDETFWSSRPPAGHTKISRAVVEDVSSRVGFGDRIWPSTGVLAIGHFLSLYPVVHIVGFDFFEHPTHHYFPHDDKNWHHNGCAERKYVEDLVKQGRLVVLTDE